MATTVIQKIKPSEIRSYFLFEVPNVSEFPSHSVCQLWCISVAFIYSVKSASCQTMPDYLITLLFLPSFKDSLETNT